MKSKEESEKTSSSQSEDSNIPNSTFNIQHSAKGFALAVNMLTIIPFFKIHDFFKGINGYAVMSYPVVGALLGGILWLLYTLLLPFFPEVHLHIVLFVLWVLLTGALHLDGFSDTVDGLFVPKERAEEVMKDPHTGGMGMIFTVTFLIFKASSLWFLEAIWLLPVILMLSRYNTVLAIYFFPYIRKEGMSTLAKQEFTKKQLMISTAVVITVVVLSSSWLLLAVSLLTLLLIKHFFVKRLGGFSGDIYGFLIEVTELLLLNILLIGVAA
ncbi:MAG: adenosylcobinamide-GDP ribazoletransferase [Helicobacteraceae bacterium]|nr:adenosylcobinamide-GDP ribazoletransferase [Helicobacteraceae bacterium]